MNKVIFGLLLFLAGHSLVFAQKFVIDTTYYPTKGQEKNIAMISLGGSEGGYPSNDYVHNELTKLGYPCMAVAYFKTKNTPQNLSDIPLEYFEQAIESYSNRPEIKGKKLVVIGKSKGGELALLLASRYPKIKGVIAVVPSNVVWQGINADWSAANSSSWSYQGQPLPYVPYDSISDKKYVELYELSLQQKAFVEKATIPVEKISGAVLLSSGAEDKMWPATSMCDEVIQRLKNNDFQHWYRHDAYEHTGHVFDPKSVWLGGTEEGNKKAKDAFEKSVLSFLKIVDEK